MAIWVAFRQSAVGNSIHTLANWQIVSADLTATLEKGAAHAETSRSRPPSLLTMRRLSDMPSFARCRTRQKEPSRMRLGTAPEHLVLRRVRPKLSNPPRTVTSMTRSVAPPHTFIATDGALLRRRNCKRSSSPLILSVEIDRHEIMGIRLRMR